MTAATSNGPLPAQPPQQPAPQSAPHDPTQLEQWFQTATQAQVDQLIADIRATDIDPEGAQQNTDVQRFFNWIGWTERTPEVLDEKSWQAKWQAEGQPTRIYHGDYGFGQSTDREFALQFMGNRYTFGGQQMRQYNSTGIHGDGTYFSDKASIARTYGTNQFRGFFNANAKVIDAYTLGNDFGQEIRSGSQLGRFLSSLTGGYGTRGGSSAKTVYAAIRGYNVIDGGWTKSVVDRSVVTMSSKQRHWSNRVMSSSLANW